MWENRGPLFSWRDKSWYEGKRSGETELTAPKKRGWETTGEKEGNKEVGMGGHHRNQWGEGAWDKMSRQGERILEASLVCCRSVWMHCGCSVVLLQIVEQRLLKKKKCSFQLAFWCKWSITKKTGNFQKPKCQMWFLGGFAGLVIKVVAL